MHATIKTEVGHTCILWLNLSNKTAVLWEGCRKHNSRYTRKKYGGQTYARDHRNWTCEQSEEISSVFGSYYWWVSHWSVHYYVKRSPEAIYGSQKDRINNIKWSWSFDQRSSSLYNLDEIQIFSSASNLWRWVHIGNSHGVDIPCPASHRRLPGGLRLSVWWHHR